MSTTTTQGGSITAEERAKAERFAAMSNRRTLTVEQTRLVCRALESESKARAAAEAEAERAWKAARHIEQTEKARATAAEAELATERAARQGWEEDAARFARNERWLHGLLVETASHLGDEVRTNDAGQVTPEPFVSKIPEAVKNLRAARERAEEAHSRAAKNEVALAARAEQAEAALQREYADAANLRDAWSYALKTLGMDQSVPLTPSALRVWARDLNAHDEKAEAAAAVRTDALHFCRLALNEVTAPDDPKGTRWTSPLIEQAFASIDAALAADAGTALLAEREALRAEVERLKTTSEVHRLRDLSARVAELEALVRHAIDVLDEDVDEAWLRDARAALSGTAPAEGTTSPTDHYDKWLRVFKPAPAEGTGPAKGGA